MRIKIKNKKLLLLLSISLLIFLSGCASNPEWKHYREAQACHFQHGDFCGSRYRDAIRANPKLPGVHASYGTHLISKGEVDKGIKELNIEMANHPESKVALQIVINGKNKTIDSDRNIKDNSIQ